MSYTPTGPFANGSAPGISATFLNNVENFLVTVNSAATDSHITADGAGNETVTGNESVGGDVSLTTNAKALKGKDQAGTTYPIAAFDGTTAKQVNLMDGTAGQLVNVKSNTKVNGTLESTGAATMDSTLAVTGTSTLTGDVSAVGNVSLTTNNKFLKGKDQAGNTYNIAGFDPTTAKQLNLMDGTVGQLLNIEAATKVNGTLESTGAATMDTTLTVTGDATFNGAGNGITVTNNSLISGNETVSGTLTVNGAGTALSVANNATITGTSTLTGDVSAVGNVSLTTNNKFYKGKDQAGVTYPIAGFNSVTAKQLDLLDGTAGQLANIKSNTKVNGTLESTGAATFDTTTTHTGAATFNAAINPSPAAGLTYNGTASGTITVYEYMQGTIKKCMVIFNNVAETVGTGGPSYTLTTPYTVGATVHINGCGNQCFGYADGTNTQQNSPVLTALAFSGGTITATSSYASNDSIVFIKSGGIKRIILNTNTTPRSGIITIEGF